MINSPRVSAIVMKTTWRCCLLLYLFRLRIPTSIWPPPWQLAAQHGAPPGGATDVYPTWRNLWTAYLESYRIRQKFLHLYGFYRYGVKDSYEPCPEQNEHRRTSGKRGGTTADPSVFGLNVFGGLWRFWSWHFRQSLIWEKIFHRKYFQNIKSGQESGTEGYRNPTFFVNSGLINFFDLK